MNAPIGIRDLAQPFGGLFGASRYLRTGSDEPRVSVQVSRLGDITHIWTHLGHKQNRCHAPVTIEGGGTGLTSEDSSLPSLAEGLERYCTSIFSDAQFISASAAELGNTALDLDSIPRCSPKELAHPRCPIAAPDKKAPIRWVQATSLLSGRMTYVPAVMVYLYAGYASAAERIWIPITTGCAAHRSYERAVLGAILEVVERDALSILWLHELPLPRIDIDTVSASLAPYWERYQRASGELEYLFFDATTDLGIPTVYSLQLSRHNKRVHSLVSCSSALDPFEAVIKVMRDMASCRLPFRVARTVPANWDNFTDLFHGAAFMAQAEQAKAFDFLLNSVNRCSLSNIPAISTDTDKSALRDVLGRFRARGWDIFAVDLSTDEALRAGFRIVRVLIPALQPFSFQYRARYLGHPRVYQAPVRMGYPERSEEELNPWPQPFS